MNYKRFLYLLICIMDFVLVGFWLYKDKPLLALLWGIAGVCMAYNFRDYKGE